MIKINQLMKSLPKILLFLLLGFLSLGIATTSVYAADGDLNCNDPVTLAVIKDPETCEAIKTLFTNNTNQGPWYSQNPQQFAKKVFGGSQDEIFGERYTYAQINWIINSISTMMNPASGIQNPSQLFDFINAAKAVLTKSQNGDQLAIADYAKLGPAGLVAGGVNFLYSTPPASAVVETKNLASKMLDFELGTQTANAQGYGFSGLGGTTNSAVKTLWGASRNMAYLIMVILLIASGFLIMFRIKINPQTVVSLQTMIPKLIITMLLVTFSFAIAGLVIDFVYVILVALVGFMSINGLVDNPVTLTQFLTTSGFGQYATAQMITSLIVSLIFMSIIFLLGLGASFVPVVGTAAAGLLVFLEVIIAIVFCAFWLLLLGKIFVMLVKAYVMLILQICIGPLQIMLDLVPGQKGFGPWIRGIISNASVFVVVPIMFVIQHVLSGDITNWVFGLHTFTGAGNAALNLPFLNSKLTGWDFIIKWIMGFVVLSLTPKVADIVRDSLKIPPFKYGSAIGEAILPVTAKPIGAAITGTGRSISKDAKSPLGSITGGTLEAIGGGIGSIRT